MSQPRYASYSDITNPTLKDAISTNCLSTVHLAELVAEFAQQMASAHRQFATEIQTIIDTFRARSDTLKRNRYVDRPSTIFGVWEGLLKETEVDAQAHQDAASLLLKNVSVPLHEVSRHKQSQAQKLEAIRDEFDTILYESETKFTQVEQDYQDSFGTLKNCGVLNNREHLQQQFHNCHNEYILQIRASNRTVDEFTKAIPQVLEGLDEIYIDTSNTINVAIESHSLLLLTKANEQQKRFENLLKICRQVNPQLDISNFAKSIHPEDARLELQRHKFIPVDHTTSSTEDAVMSHLIIDRNTDIILRERRSKLQKEAVELTSHIKRNQDVTHALVSICQRNLANHLYAKVYETQEDMCRKRNEIRIANLQLAAVRAQIELLTPKQNGSVDDDQDKKNPSSIRGMWKKAFKSMKSSASEPKLFKKSSLHKKKQNSKDEDDPVCSGSGPVDPVYSLLKCAADLPRSGVKSLCSIHPHCSGQHPGGSGSGAAAYTRYPSGGDSSGSTSKTSSPSSSVTQSPKTRRRKLNARMKSFSLDTPEAPKHLLGIDETTKKKSSSFTNTCFGGKDSPDERTSFSAVNLRKKFGFAKASSLEIEERRTQSYSPSPKDSPKLLRKQTNMYVVLYNFKAKEKDDMDLRAGWRVHVSDSSKKDWWKGKRHGKTGYFPATYVIPVQENQRIFQVLQPLNLSDGFSTIKFHKDQIVLQVGDEVDEMITIRAANNRQALCPLAYLQEL